MSDTVGRIEQLTQETQREMHGRRWASYWTAYRAAYRAAGRTSSRVDHRELLRKYILRTFTSEPVDSVSLASPAAFIGEWLEHCRDFTAEEKAELVRLASEEAGRELEPTWWQCRECGWEALGSIPGRIYAHNPGDHCKYGCGDTMRPHPGKRQILQSPPP